MKAQDKVYGIIKKFVYQFYNEYKDPKEYLRTYQFLESLVQSRVVSDGKGYKVEIYFDASGMNYPTEHVPRKSGWEGSARWDGETVLKVAMEGEFPHGGYAGAGGTPIWGVATAELDAKAINILIDMLRAEGIPVKK